MMFKNFNKNWHKVLVPQVVMVMLTLAVFFLCRLGGTDDKTAIFVAFITSLATIAAPAFVSRSNKVVFFTFAAGIASLTLPFTAIIASDNISINIDIAAIVIAIIISTAIPILASVEDNKLHKFWAMISYLTEELAIFLPIYFTVS